MKLRLSRQHQNALTLFEVWLAVCVIVVVAVVLLSAVARPEAQKKAQKINCSNNLKQLGLAYRIWAGDNNDLFPMGLSVTHGGSREMSQAGDALLSYIVMSNEISSTKILLCPNDKTRLAAKNFGDLTSSNVSYFVGIDTTNDLDPLMILSGDNNLQIGGEAVKPGLLSISTNAPVSWQPKRHKDIGYIGLADWSVQTATDSGLRAYLVGTGQATNRLAIP